MEQEATETLSIEEANELVLKHTGWAESIARSVARGWNLDWQQDGLDGAAMEALIFCSRRYTPDRGVPFKGYARRRVHEAATEAARKSKGWEKKNSNQKNERLARAISAELFDIFPGLRSGNLSVSQDESGSDGESVRVSIRQLLVGATLIATRQDLASTDPDAALDYKKALHVMAKLETIHQVILWRIYWEEESMRSVASDWEIDELNVIREHKAILEHVQKALMKGSISQALRVRPGLKQTALQLKRDGTEPPFSKMYKEIKKSDG